MAFEAQSAGAVGIDGFSDRGDELQQRRLLRRTVAAAQRAVSSRDPGGELIENGRMGGERRRTEDKRHRAEADQTPQPETEHRT